MTTFRYRWFNHRCQPECVCGWRGMPTSTVKSAKSVHAVHVLEDCPIGNRKAI